MKLRSHLLALVMAVLVPMIAFSAIVVVAFGRQQRAAVERGAVETTRALMNAVDQSLNGSVSQLVALAHARSLARGDLRELDADVKHALPSRPCAPPASRWWATSRPVPRPASSTCRSWCRC